MSQRAIHEEALRQLLQEGKAADIRGNPLYLDDEGIMRFQDDGAVATVDTPRACPRCDRPPVACDRCDGELHDACIGHLPGVEEACCGHGRRRGYMRLAGETAIRELSIRGLVGSPRPARPTWPRPSHLRATACC